MAYVEFSVSRRKVLVFFENEICIVGTLLFSETFYFPDRPGTIHSSGGKINGKAEKLQGKFFTSFLKHKEGIFIGDCSFFFFF